MEDQELTHGSTSRRPHRVPADPVRHHLSVGGTALLYFVMSRGPSVPATAVLVLKPAGSLQETVPDDVVGQFLGQDEGRCVASCPA
jgi:hypothetical protein